MTVRVDEDLVAWIETTLERTTSLSTFVSEAVADKIARTHRIAEDQYPTDPLPPRRSVTPHFEASSIEWLNENLPRRISISSFVTEAVREAIRPVPS